MITGEQIREARKLLGWSRDRWAPKAGTNTNWLGLIESGKRELRPDEAEKFLAALEAAGVEFTKGEARGVRLRATKESRGKRSLRSMGQPNQLRAALESSLGLVNEWLGRIVAGNAPDLDLRNLRATLMNVLDLVEEDDQINRASDAVYAAAVAFREEVARAAASQTKAADRALGKREQAMEAALAALRRALQTAQPSAVSRRQRAAVHE